MARQKLQVLATQLAIAAPGAPSLIRLVDRVRQLAAIALARSPIAGRLGPSRATVASLARTIRRLNDLLTDLYRLSPDSQRRLDPALLALRTLWTRLSDPRSSGAAMPGTQDGRGLVFAFFLAPRTTGSAERPGPADGTPTSLILTDARAGGAPQMPATPGPAGGAQRRAHRQGDRASTPRRHVAALASPSPVAPLLGGGAPGSAGGPITAAGAGGAALLVTALAMWLLGGLLGDRLTLDGSAFRSALLGRRLERPG